MTRADLITRIRTGGYLQTPTLARITESGAGSPDVAIGSVIDDAVLEFSRDVPRICTATGTDTGADITLEGWTPFSSVTGVERPAGQTPPARENGYSVDRFTGTLRFTSARIGETYIVRYTALHDVSDASASISIADAHLGAFQWLCVAHICTRLAISHGETMSPSMHATNTNFLSKSGEYSRLAKAAMERYRTMMGLPKEPVLMGAGFAVDVIDPDTSNPEPYPTWPL